MSFDVMAAEREVEAEKLDEMTIWISIVGKFLILDLPLEVKASMLMESVPQKLIKDVIILGIENEVFEKDRAEELLNIIESMLIS